MAIGILLLLIIKVRVVLHLILYWSRYNNCYQFIYFVSYSHNSRHIHLCIRAYFRLGSLSSSQGIYATCFLLSFCYHFGSLACIIKCTNVSIYICEGYNFSTVFCLLCEGSQCQITRMSCKLELLHKYPKKSFPVALANSSLDWLNFDFLYAIFVQRSILPTELISYPIPPHPLHFECPNYSFILRKERREQVKFVAPPKEMLLLFSIVL